MSKVVVGLDGSPGAQRALEWAVGEARLRGATLEMVHVFNLFPEHMLYAADFYPYPPRDPVESDEEARQRAQEMLTKALENADVATEDISVTHTVKNGQAARVLVDLAGEDDLLVVGSRGLGGFTGLVLGSVSQQCVQHARCPVVVIPPEE